MDDPVLVDRPACTRGIPGHARRRVKDGRIKRLWNESKTYRGLPVTERPYTLFELLKFEPHALGFIKGDAIAAAAGFKSAKHFANNYLSAASTSSVRAPGLLSQHFPFGHALLANGEPMTHPNSAAVFGDRIREAVTAGRQERTLGWRSSRRCPVSSSPDTVSRTTNSFPTEIGYDGLLVRVIGPAFNKSGRGSGG